jgi:hypothetical protein
MTLKSDAIRRVEIEIKLHINKRLYEKAYITEEMYIKATQKFLEA